MSGFDVPIIGSIVSFTVQLFFVYRIWILSGKSSWFICLSICLCSAVATVAGFSLGVYAEARNQFPSGRVLNFKSVASIWLGGNALADLLITGSMLYHLARRRRDGRLSDHTLTRIVRLSVETNLLTTTVDIVALLMVLIYPEQQYFTCPVAILGKLYSNTLLVSLNNRISIREGRGAVVRSPAVTFATDSGLAVEIMQMELKRSLGAVSESSERASTEQGARKVFDIV